MIYKIPLGHKLKVLETKIRDRDTGCADLRQSLIELGRIMGDELLGQSNLTAKSVMTPLLSLFAGVQSQHDDGISIIISTKDDYYYFAKGIAEGCSTVYRGFIDFDGARGNDVYSSPYRSIELPEINHSLSVKRIIIAKSVIASGCTAITLAKTALSKYFPEELIIVAPFYSQKGLDELQVELRNAKIFLAFGPDALTAEGMLVPGVGDIDARLAG